VHVVLEEGRRLAMSTSSASDVVVVAITRAPVGVDIVHTAELEGLDEQTVARHVPNAEVVRDALPPGAGLPELWTAVEALAKVTSHGLDASESHLREAVASHRLRWTRPEPGLVSCIAVHRGDADPEVVDLRVGRGDPVRIGASLSAP
jgi:hypothetical protein